MFDNNVGSGQGDELRGKLRRAGVQGEDGLWPG